MFCVKARVPEPGDVIIIKKPFRSDDRAQILFKEGMHCTIEKVDENCDIFVSHPSWSKYDGHWIKSTKFKRITLKVNFILASHFLNQQILKE